MQPPTRFSDRTTPDAFREIATIAQRAEEFRAPTSLGWNNCRFQSIVQRHVNNVRPEHSPIFETHASDIAPSKSLIPFRFEVRKNTNTHPGIVKLYGEDVVETLPGA
jgi:hypothetical protein